MANDSQVRGGSDASERHLPRAVSHMEKTASAVSAAMSTISYTVSSRWAILKDVATVDQLRTATVASIVDFWGEGIMLSAAYRRASTSSVVSGIFLPRRRAPSAVMR